VAAFDVVGYGVFVTKPVTQGEFLAEYCGKLKSWKEGSDIADQTYIYYFSLKSEKYW